MGLFTFYKTIGRRKIKKIEKSNITFFAIIASAVLILVISLDFFDDDFDFHDILVEMHGLVFDLIVFGIILTIFENKRNNKIKKSNLLDELDDYRYWESEEALFRLRGIRSRLLELGVEKINLSHCMLKEEEFLGQGNSELKCKDFIGSNLQGSYFKDLDLSGTNFSRAKLQNSTFYSCKIKNVNFQQSNLNNASFINCEFGKNDFLMAIVTNSNWFEVLKKNNNKGIYRLVEEFSIKELPHTSGVYEIEKSN